MKIQRIKIPCRTKSVAVLLLLALFLISSRAITNALGPLQWYIINDLDINNYEYGVLVSLALWASLLDVIHGYLLDRYVNIVPASWLYVCLVIIGYGLSSAAGYLRAYWLLVLGRTLIGLGLNPLFLLANKHTIRWFGCGKYVNFICSFCESISWLGSSIPFLLTGPLIDLMKSSAFTRNIFANANATELTVFTAFTATSMITLAYMYGRNDVRTSAIRDGVPAGKANPNSSPDECKVHLKFRDYVSLPKVFWLFALSAFLYYVNILSFISMSVLYFSTNYGLPSKEACTLSGLISLLPAIVSPFSGLMLDKIGHNLTSFTVAILLNIISVGALIWTPVRPLLPVIAMGVSVTAATGIWSQFQFLVEGHQYMIAYGVAQTGLNGAQALGTMLAGLIIDYYGYQGFMIFQFCIITSAVPFIAAVWVLDLRRKNFLNLTSEEKNRVLGRLSTEKPNNEQKDKQKKTCDA